MVGAEPGAVERGQTVGAWLEAVGVRLGFVGAWPRPWWRGPGRGQAAVRSRGGVA